MKITRRQKDVIRKMISLYHQIDGQPIHYTKLAEFIGVSRFTAYDMLKVLEEKGLVQSRYRTNEQGHGRSEVVFEPTPFAHQLVAEVATDIAADNWEKVKTAPEQQALKAQNEQIGQEVLGRILPTDESPNVRQCAELHAVLFVRLRDTLYFDRIKNQLPRLLPQNKPVHRSHLTLLNGMALGLLASAHEIHDNTWWDELLEQTEQYHALISAMDTADCQRLAEIIPLLLTSPELQTHGNGISGAISQ